MKAGKTTYVESVTAASPAQTEIRIIPTRDATAWNQYLARRGPGHLFLRAEWERVFGVYRLPFYRLAAVRDGRIVGVLPLVWQRSTLFGNHFAALPWFDAAGVLADDSEARRSLVEAARRMAESHGARTIQLRQVDSLELSLYVRTDKVLMRLDLEADPETLWKSFSPKVRNQVRKGEKSGLSVRRGGRELVPELFRVYSRNMRDLGSPPHHRRVFEAVCECFPDRTRLYLVRLDEKAVGAALVMANGDSLEVPWASSLREHNRCCVNHFMYWNILEDACREGFARFHFGRSTRDSGTYHFKKQWGARPIQLYWYYVGQDRDAAAQTRSPQESYGWATRVWRRLPLWLARSLGPRIIAKLP